MVDEQPDLTDSFAPTPLDAEFVAPSPVSEVVSAASSDGRDQYGTAELAKVLSHYDLGAITRMHEVRRGSRRAPKLRIVSDRGEYLLKRRGPGRDDPTRVRFAHDVERKLARHAFPLAALIPMRDTDETALHLGPPENHIYELFEFVIGYRDDHTLAAASEAGRVLGRFHRLLEGHVPSGAPTSGSYHRAPAIRAAIKRIPQRISARDPQMAMDDMASRCRRLVDAYESAADHADALGLSSMAMSVVHGDWHPGNLLFRGHEIVAVLDFDSIRVEPRVIDVANAALQFSMVMVGDDPAAWPDHLHVKRIRALLDGYHSESSSRLSPDEFGTIPWLIIEALIIESVVPIARAGQFAHLSGGAFLAMVERKVRWIEPRAPRLAEFLGEANTP